MTIKKIDLAYVAGFLDAEAGFQIKRYKARNEGITHRLMLGIRVSSTNKEILEFLKDRFSGSIGEHKLNKNIGKWKPAWRWQLQSRKAFKLIEAVYPYLIIKKPQADVMFKFQATMTNSTYRLPEHIWKKRLKLKDKINKLNKRGL